MAFTHVRADVTEAVVSMRHWQCSLFGSAVKSAEVV
jgi:hypothetical protein